MVPLLSRKPRRKLQLSRRQKKGDKKAPCLFPNVIRVSLFLFPLIAAFPRTAFNIQQYFDLYGQALS